MRIMMQKLSGKCLCGKIKFAREAEIQRVANCHCTDCQNVTGATYATLVSVAENMIKIDGTPRVYHHKSDRDSDMEKHFCDNCGSQMFSYNSTRPGIIHLRAGVLEQKELVEPIMNQYTDSKITSTPLNPDLPAHPKMPA